VTLVIIVFFYIAPNYLQLHSLHPCSN